MSNGTFSTLKSLINGRFRLFSLGMLLASSLVYSTSLMAKCHRSDESDSKCHCTKANKGPKGDVGRAGPSGDNNYGGLENYASFQLITSSVTDQNDVTEPVSFGKLVAGRAGDDNPIESSTDASRFTLDTGSYKIAVGVSTFGTLGTQLLISLNGDALYNWPLDPTNSVNTSFIELTFMLEVTEPDSIIQFATTQTIPATPVNEKTLQNYLFIEKIN